MTPQAIVEEVNFRFLRVMAAIAINDFAEAHVQMLAHAAGRSAFFTATRGKTWALAEMRGRVKS